MALTADHQSTNVLTATLKDDSDADVTGATVTVTIVDPAGVALVTDATMTDQSDGTYDYTISNTLLPNPGVTYTAQITAVSGSNQRYAEIAIDNEIDRD